LASNRFTAIFDLSSSHSNEKSAENHVPADFFVLHTNAMKRKATDFLILKID